MTCYELKDSGKNIYVGCIFVFSSVARFFRRLFGYFFGLAFGILPVAPLLALPFIRVEQGLTTFFGGQSTALVQDLLARHFLGGIAVCHFGVDLLDVLSPAGSWCFGKIILQIYRSDHFVITTFEIKMVRDEDYPDNQDIKRFLNLVRSPRTDLVCNWETRDSDNSKTWPISFNVSSS